MLDAHVDLAKTEMAGIGAQIARMVGLGCFAVTILVLLGLMLFVGLALFLGEWLLGSMGWGIVHGSLLFPGIAIAAVLVALGFSAGRLAGWFGLALLIGAGVAVVLGLHLLNGVYASVGDAIFAGIDPAYRTIVAGMLVGSIVLAIVGAIVALVVGGGEAFLLVLVGIVVGALLGALTAITFDWQPAVALGLTVTYLAWIGLMAADAVRTGIDTEELKNRFIPNQTIDTTKESIEWLKRRMPRGNES